MAEEPKPIMLNRHGRPVRVQRIPPKGTRGKFIKPNPEANLQSPFDRFSSTNGNGNKITSY